jgi:hypothetical protein
MNCRELNEILISGKANDEQIQLIELLELGDPELSMLSPLAKAAWRLQSLGHLSAEDAEAALASTVLIAGEDSEGLLSGDSICTFEEEKVEHVIPIKVTSQHGTRIINITFESVGNLQCILGGEAPLTQWLTLDCLAEDWRTTPREEDTPFGNFLFNTYKRFAQHRSPACYPCDTEFIGIIEYRLLGVEGERVSGPSLQDQKHWLEWLDYGLLAKEPNGRQFCWLHQLSLAQAHSLGLARSSGTHQDPDMPEWLADNVTFSKLWIGPDDLYESYSEGKVTDYEVDSLLLCLGAGPEWSPGDLDSENNNLGQIEDYPKTQRPIKAFSLSKGFSCDDPDLNQALQLLDRLIQVKNA